MSNVAYRQDILDKFKEAFQRDESFIKDWIVTWEYQERRKKRKVNYIEGLPEEFYTYNDPKDIIQWVNWMLNVEKANFFESKSFAKWSEASLNFDKKIFDSIDFKVDEEVYNKGIGNYNAQDFYYANLIPYPGESDPLRILDFGAGYGRQSNLWSQNRPDAIYVGMDAIPKSYCLQHFYYSQTEKLVQDYVVNPESFSLINADPGIHHLPTWRWDLLPDNYFDKILLVQVLQELNSKLVKEMIKMFHRVLKPGGSIYIRDKESQFRPAHRLDSNKIFRESGFTLEFRAHVLHKKELHGIPRIWRKTRSEVVKSQEITTNQRLKEWMVDIDALSNGKIKSLFKSFIKD